MNEVLKGVLAVLGVGGFLAVFGWLVIKGASLFGGTTRDTSEDPPPTAGEAQMYRTYHDVP